MRQFTGTGGRLRALSFHARAVYSIFLAFTLAGLLLSLWLAHDMLGSSLSTLTQYYTGENSVPSAPVDNAEKLSGGPELELPADLEPLGAAEPMARRKLLEVTHFHLFSMPVYLVILSHLYILSTALALSKMVWVGIATVSTALHILAPWAAAASWPLAGSLYALSGVGLMLSYFVMSAIPLFEMWTTKHKTLTA